MSRNLGFCGLAVIVFLMTVVRPAASGGCADPDLFRGWGETAPPVAVLGTDGWYRASLGWILAPGDCAARQVAEEMQAATSAFERHFGVLAPRGAVIDVAHARHAPALKEAGAAWVLPWRFEEADAAAVARAETIRAQVRAQLASGGREPDPAQVEALVQRALGRLEDSDEPVQPALEPKAIRHEIAHLLFMHAVWPSSAGRGEQYGGDAPDWLDEAAAVVAESARMTERRRRAFRELARSGRTIPLAEYLDMEHPVYAGGDFRALIDQAREQAEADGAAVVSASLPAENLERARAFYSQTRGFTDYLMQQTGDERVLAKIVTEMRRGADFEAWLATFGVESGLPADIQVLEREFDSWARDAEGVQPGL